MVTVLILIALMFTRWKKPKKPGIVDEISISLFALIVEFEDGKEPPVSANLDVAGGRLVSVLFGDYRDDFFQPEEVDVVREALNELSVDNDDAHAEIIQKMELLTH